ncbi:MAG: alpha/beta hydrolase [Chloroflexota bacterium]
MTTPDHENQPILTGGAPLADATAAVILLHGRGSRAQDIIPLAQQLPHKNVAYLAPQADGNAWYPRSGFAPLEVNEPYLTSARNTIAALIQKVTGAGIPLEKLFLGGFSQGACLASEYVGENAKRYGGLFVLSGAMMGPMDREHGFTGSLDGMPVFIGGVDNDSWVNPAQFELTRDVLAALGAAVTLQILEGSQHTIRESELAHVRAMIASAGGV